MVADAAVDRAPTKVTTWVRRLAALLPRLLPRLPDPGRRRRPGAGPGPAVAGRGARGSDWPSASACSGCPHPRRCDACRVPTGPGRPSTLLPRPTAVPHRRRRPAVDRRVRPGRRWPRSTARRCSSTTRPTCGPRCREAVEAWGDGVAYATKAFLCVAMARLAHEEGMCLDVSTGGELHVALDRRGPGRPAGAPRQQQVRPRSWPPPSPVGRGPDRRRLLRRDRPHRAAGRRSAGSRAVPRTPSRVRWRPRCWPGSPRGSRSTPTSSSAPARRTRSSASDWPRGRPPGPSTGWPTWTRPGWSSSSGIHAHLGSQVFALEPFAQAVEVLAEFFAPLGPARAGGGRRARRGLRQRRGGAAHGRSGRTSVRAGLPPGRHRRRRSGSPPSRAGPSWPPPGSPSTGSGRSRTCPATGPTCRSTAG